LFSIAFPRSIERPLSLARHIYFKASWYFNIGSRFFPKKSFGPFRRSTGKVERHRCSRRPSIQLDTIRHQVTPISELVAALQLVCSPLSWQYREVSCRGDSWRGFFPHWDRTSTRQQIGKAALGREGLNGVLVQAAKRGSPRTRHKGRNLSSRAAFSSHKL
jgi:hypothetical protein